MSSYHTTQHAIHQFTVPPSAFESMYEAICMMPVVPPCIVYHWQEAPSRLHTFRLRLVCGYGRNLVAQELITLTRKHGMSIMAAITPEGDLYLFIANSLHLCNRGAEMEGKFKLYPFEDVYYF